MVRLMHETLANDRATALHDLLAFHRSVGKYLVVVKAADIANLVGSWATQIMTVRVMTMVVMMLLLKLMKMVVRTVKSMVVRVVLPIGSFLPSR
jgi:hypothetical protein